MPDIEQAKARLERAFRVKFDREPISEQETTLIALVSERVANGEQFFWEGSTESPTLRFSQDQEHDEETRWILAKEAVCKLGLNQREAAEKYGLSYEALRKKCQREEWPIPVRVAQAVPIVSQNRIIALKEAETWLEKGERSRAMTWKLTEKHLSRLAERPDSAPPVESWSDVAQIVKLNRQAAGLDTSETTVAQTFNFAMLGQDSPEPIIEIQSEKGEMPE